MNKTAISNLRPWQKIIDVWKSGQILLPEVVRWEKYLKGGQARRQNSLQHSYSIGVLGQIFVYKMRRYINLDELLILRALLIHDHGEGEIKKDTHFIDKTEQGDLVEYRAFVKRFSGLGDEGLFEEFRRAFLLQFALSNPKNFPHNARLIMSELFEHKQSECYAFAAIECWDYVLYAMEQYLEQGNEKILVQTLRNQTPLLNMMATNALPGFGKVIWTPIIQKWCQRFVDSHKGKWLESKGEK